MNGNVGMKTEFQFESLYFRPWKLGGYAPENVRKEQEYLQYQRQNNLFFDEQTDEQLIKLRKKLSKKRQQYTELITKIYKETELYKAYKLNNLYQNVNTHPK